MTKIKPCILCGNDDMYPVMHEDSFFIDTHSIFCNSCKSRFSNEIYEDTEEETIEWYNGIAGDCE